MFYSPPRSMIRSIALLRVKKPFIPMTLMNKNVRSFATEPKKPLTDAEQLRRVEEDIEKRTVASEEARDAARAAGSGVKPPLHPTAHVYDPDPVMVILRNWVFSGFGLIDNDYKKAHLKGLTRNRYIVSGIKWGIGISFLLFLYFRYRRRSFEQHRRLFHSNSDIHGHGVRI